MKKQKIQEKSENEDNEEKDKKTEFWKRSQVGTVQEISLVNSQNKYIIPN